MRKNNLQQMDDKFRSFIGPMPKEYRPLTMGVPEPLSIIVKGQYTWQRPREAYDRNGGETTPERDRILIENLKGEAYQKLQKMAQEQGFNGLFDVRVVTTKFDDDLVQQGVMVGASTIHGTRICTLTAEALAYHMRRPKN